MPYTLTLATEATRDLVVESLTAEADKRTRVARGAAQQVAADKLTGTKDVRASAVRVAMLLAEAGTLADLARELRDAPELPLVTQTTDARIEALRAQLAGDNTAPEDTTPAEDTAPADDDGLSAAAHAAAALADEYEAEHLADPDEADVDTGADPEDEPADDDVAEALR